MQNVVHFASILFENQKSSNVFREQLNFIKIGSLITSTLKPLKIVLVLQMEGEPIKMQFTGSYKLGHFLAILKC